MNNKIIIVGQNTEDTKQCFKILTNEGYQVEITTIVDGSFFKKKFR